MSETVADRLDAICAEFAELDPRERLELLLEFAESLPALPERYVAERDAGLHRVQECQTPVFLWVGNEAGKLKFFGHVAPEAPTVKGFVSILNSILTDAPPEEGLQLAPNVVQRLGLLEALGMQRARGLQAILMYIQRLIAAAKQN